MSDEEEEEKEGMLLSRAERRGYRAGEMDAASHRWTMTDSARPIQSRNAYVCGTDAWVDFEAGYRMALPH